MGFARTPVPNTLDEDGQPDNRKQLLIFSAEGSAWRNALAVIGPKRIYKAFVWCGSLDKLSGQSSETIDVVIVSPTTSPKVSVDVVQLREYCRMHELSCTEYPDVNSFLKAFND
jgi:hypothetical protein